MREIQINVRLTESEAEKLDKVSKEYVRSKSNTIRYLILNAFDQLASRHRFHITEMGREELARSNNEE